MFLRATLTVMAWQTFLQMMILTASFTSLITTVRERLPRRRFGSIPSTTPQSRSMVRLSSTTSTMTANPMWLFRMLYGYYYHILMERRYGSVPTAVHWQNIMRPITSLMRIWFGLIVFWATSQETDIYSWLIMEETFTTGCRLPLACGGIPIAIPLARRR